jgi:ABC-type glycerol-3-phosphate transport system permease component
MTMRPASKVVSWVGKVPANVGLYVVLIAVATLVIYPLFWMFSNAFRSTSAIQTSPLGLPTSLYLGNFEYIVNQTLVITWIRNSVVVTTASVVGIVGLSAMAAYAFDAFRFRGRELLYAFMLMGLMIPTVGVLIAAFTWVDFLHLVDSPLALIFTYWGWSSFGIAVMRDAFRSVPQEIKDAARVDGAGDWVIFARILLPNTRPSVTTVAIFNFMWVWNDFIYPLVFLQSPGNYTIAVGIMQFQGTYSYQWGWLMAALALSVIIPLIAYVLFQRQLVRGILEGALRG